MLILGSKRLNNPFFFRTGRQWRDLSFCLAQLSYNERGVRKLQENFACFHDKLSDEDVYGFFTAIIGKCKKFAKPEMKVTALKKTCFIRFDRKGNSKNSNFSLYLTQYLPSWSNIKFPTFAAVKFLHDKVVRRFACLEAAILYFYVKLQSISGLCDVTGWECA